MNQPKAYFVNCSECGAQLQRKRYQALKYKKFFCNNVCRALQMKVPNPLSREEIQLRQRARINTDPEYRAKKRAWDRAAYLRAKAIPGKRKKQHQKTNEWRKRKRKSDPKWAARERAYKRKWLRKWRLIRRGASAVAPPSSSSQG